MDFLGFNIYVVDTETTGLDYKDNDIIELSILRCSDSSQKTWTMQPKDFNNISDDALKVNGFTREQLKTFEMPEKVVPSIENFLNEDDGAASDRILVGQNISFDYNFMTQLWKKVGSETSFPFSRNFLDTKQIALFLDLIKGTKRSAYNLGSLAKDAGIKLDKAHKAEFDTKATHELFLYQLKQVK